MEERNEKLLGKILLGVFFIIFVIILLSLKKFLFSTDNYEYDLPKIITTTTKTIEKIADPYNVLTDEEKVEYNEKLLNDEFLLPLNNVIKNDMDLDNIDLIQSDESRFIYSYSKLALKDEDITFDTINLESINTFNNGINSDNLRKYFNDGKYYYELDTTYYYCLKATKTMNVNNKLYLKFDIISYNEESCNYKVLDYEPINEGLIVINQDEDKNYIDSFALIKKEGR